MVIFVFLNLLLLFEQPLSPRGMPQRHLSSPLPPSVQGIRPPEGTVPRASGRPAVWASMAPAALSSYHTGDPTHGPRHSSPVGRTEIAYHAVSDPRVQVGRTLPQPRSSSPPGAQQGGRRCPHSPPPWKGWHSASGRFLVNVKLVFLCIFFCFVCVFSERFFDF